MTTSNSQARVFQEAKFIGALVVSLALLTGSASAANLTVICPGGGPGAYPSISAALSTLDPHGPNTITVSGTCVENIFIDKHERLFIQSAPGQVATINAADPSSIVLQTFSSLKLCSVSHRQG
jgi:hypothetical protein